MTECWFEGRSFLLGSLHVEQTNPGQRARVRQRFIEGGWTIISDIRVGGTVTITGECR